MNNLITFYEHQFKKFKDQETSNLNENEIIHLNKNEAIELFKAINRQTNLDKTENDNKEKEFDNLFRIYPDRIKAKHYVGFTIINNKIIQVLPKVFEECNYEEKDKIIAFIRMLNIAYELKIKEQELAEVKNVASTPVIYEVFIYLFASALLNEIKRGFYREYVRIKEEKKFLKGKLLIDKQIRKLPHQRHTFSIEYHKFTENNLLNQIFFYTTYVSLRNTKWITNKKLLSELMLIFEDIALRRVTLYDFKKITFTRLNERFKKPFNLAKIILSSFGEIEGEEASGFFLDMNDLFEKFICSVLSKNLGLEIKYQESLNLFKEADKIKEKKQKPDYVVYKNNKPVLILDAKYTEIKKENGKIILSSEMLRQIYTYAKIVQHKLYEKGKKVNKFNTVLIFPRAGKYNNNFEEIKDKTKIEATFFDDEVKLYVLTYNLETLIKGEKIDGQFKDKLEEVIKIINKN